MLDRVLNIHLQNTLISLHVYNNVEEQIKKDVKVPIWSDSILSIMISNLQLIKIKLAQF